MADSTKLIIVEGIPGSGKTTLAKSIQAYLNSRDISNELFVEGHLLHPADFESVACVPKVELEKLRAMYANLFHLIEPYSNQVGDDVFVSYGLAKYESKQETPKDLYDSIQRYEIYDGIPVEKYCALTLARWTSFALEQKRRDNVIIFECCFLQNPGCAILARHNAGDELFQHHVCRVAQAISELNPMVIYLKQENIRETIHRVKLTRSQEWLDSVIWYHTEQDYGKSHDLSGFDGYIEFLEHRREVELRAKKQFPFETSIVNNDTYDWALQWHVVEQQLNERFGIQAKQGLQLHQKGDSRMGGHTEVHLARPSVAFKDEYIAFYREWLDSKEDFIPWVVSKEPWAFEEMIQSILDNEEENHLPDGWVPSTTFWLLTKSGRIVGVVNIRHRLTEKLWNSGGHIGYGIRPSERRKGYATKLLSLALHEAGKLGIQRALLVCNADNIGSQKTIRNNGGVQDTSYIDENGREVFRYWIDMDATI